MDPQTHRAFELLRRLSSEGIDLVDLDAESAVGDASVRQWLGVPHTAPLGPQGRFLCLGAVEGGSLFLWQHGATPPPVVLLGDEGEVAVASPSLEAFVRRNANERFVGRLAAWLAPEDDDEDQVAAAVAQAVRGWGPAPADPEHPDFLAWVHAHRAPEPGLRVRMLDPGAPRALTQLDRNRYGVLRGLLLGPANGGVVADLEVARRHLADPTGCGWLEHGLLAADVFPRAIQGVPAPNGVRITVGTGPFRHLELSDRDVVVAVDGVPVSSMEGLGIALSTAAKRLEFSLSVERTVGGAPIRFTKVVEVG